MKKAYDEAIKAYNMGEVPVGAVIVKDGVIIGKGFNLKENMNDPTTHAEMVAIREACRNINSWRLNGCTMYVTLEPCSMCAGALVNSRIDRVIIGTEDRRMGACGSAVNILQTSSFNHKVDIEFGIMKSECSSILSQFFKALREKRNIKNKHLD